MQTNRDVSPEGDKKRNLDVANIIIAVTNKDCHDIYNQTNDVVGSQFHEAVRMNTTLLN